MGTSLRREQTPVQCDLVYKIGFGFDDQTNKMVHHLMPRECVFAQPTVQQSVNVGKCIEFECVNVFIFRLDGLYRRLKKKHLFNSIITPTIMCLFLSHFTE